MKKTALTVTGTMLMIFLITRFFNAITHFYDENPVITILATLGIILVIYFVVKIRKA